MTYEKGGYDTEHYSWNSWQDYLALENELLDFLKIVPPDEQNLNSWSPKLANLLIIISSRLDSFFKSSIRSDIWNILKDQVKEIDEGQLNTILSKNERNWGIKDYKSFFNPLFRLKDQNLYFKLRNYQQKTPFSNWIEEEPLIWWENYNSLKHDFYANMRKATLDIVIHTFSAFFLIFSLYPDSFSTLVYRTTAVRSARDLKQYLPNPGNRSDIPLGETKTQKGIKYINFSRWENTFYPYRLLNNCSPILVESNLFLYLYQTQDSITTEQIIRSGKISDIYYTLSRPRLNDIIT